MAAAVTLPKAGIDEEKWANNKGVTQKRRRILIYKKLFGLKSSLRTVVLPTIQWAKQKRSKGTARMRLKKQKGSLICLAGLFELFSLSAGSFHCVMTHGMSHIAHGKGAQ